jgi:hypothetical protein
MPTGFIVGSERLFHLWVQSQAESPALLPTAALISNDSGTDRAVYLVPVG